MTDYIHDGITIETERLGGDPGLTDRLRSLEENTAKLSPRQRERVNFSRRFRQALRVSGIQQKDLSPRIGVSSSLVSAWANAISLPSAEQIEKLSEVFGGDVSAWIQDDEPRRPVRWEHTRITSDEAALVQRVRRMSEEERNALYTLLHVLE